MKLSITLSTIFLIFQMNPVVIVDFNENSNSNVWSIVNDVVMGGKSNSNFIIDSDGNGRFSGSVSLENNGGFCSIQHSFAPINIEGKKKFSLRLKGDGKKYQFRVKSNQGEYYSYIYQFQTSSKWENIEIPMSDMYAVFRGKKLNIPNFDGAQIAQIAFLISNSKQEDFELTIDKIEIK